MAVCPVCFRHCVIGEGELGACGARSCSGGVVIARNYGVVTSLALDPIEKKPLSMYHPGSMILSVGSYGCNLSCPFCQNHEIAHPQDAAELIARSARLTPEELAKAAASLKDRGNIGVAFTYNEPLIGYEFVRDTARRIHERGMKNVMVTNGTAELSVLEELIPYIDAINIDLKGFTDEYYRDMLGGDRGQVMRFIEEAAKHCHVELTTLIVPGLNDSEEEVRALARWIAALRDAEGHITGKGIPLHITRYFPRFNMKDRPATDVNKIYRLVYVAREELDHVFPGNC